MFIRIKFSFLLVCIFILFAIVLRVFAFLNTDFFNDEEVFRRMDSYTFSQHPLRILSDNSIICVVSGCQRGFLFLNSLLMHFVDNPVLISRLTSLIFGILIIFPYYLLIYSVFSQEIALASTFALAVSPLHIQLSVSSLGNAGAVFFIILATYFLNRYLNKKDEKENIIYLFSSIIFYILATSFRIETTLAICLFSYVLFKEKGLKVSVLFFVFSLAYLISRAWLSFGYTSLLHAATNFENYNWPFSFLCSQQEVFGRIRFFIWFNRLFQVLSLPLSVLGFLGIASALKNKKRYIIFLLGFFGFFVFLTLRDLIHNSFPFIRYSYIFTIFFIPFIFFGISYIVAFVCKSLSLKNSFKNLAVIMLLIISNVYFTFFSLNYLDEKIAGMKYYDLIYNCANWMNKNLVSGDVLFSSFGSVEIVNGLILNKFIQSDYTQKIFEGRNNYRLDKEIFNQLEAFAKQCHAAGGSQGNEPLHITLVFKKGHTQTARRLIFMLDKQDYNYLKNNFPVLLEKIEIKYDAFVYSGTLPL